MTDIPATHPDVTALTAALEPLPEGVAVSDIARHLRLDQVAGLLPLQAPVDGDLALATVLDPAGLTLDLVSGRSAQRFAGDRVIVALAGLRSPLATPVDLPRAQGPCILADRCGIAGQPLLGDATARGLRLIGLLADAHGQRINLSTLRACHLIGGAPLYRLGVISAARGARAAGVTTALVRGLVRMGLRPATAKLTGLPDAAERWALRDAGAIESLDLPDAGHASALNLEPIALATALTWMTHHHGAAGADASLLRLAGGLASPELRRLLEGGVLAGQIDGAVIAAADALSAQEAVRRVRAAGLRVLAVGGAITRSPLASREAAAALDVPLLGNDELARPATLQRLLLQAAGSGLALAA